MKVPSAKDVARRNAGVDLKQIESAGKMLKKVHASGVRRPTYRISSPFRRVEMHTQD